MEKKIYNYISKGTKFVENIYIDLYSFKCEFNHAYIVEVEKHNSSIYLFQFYLKSHTDSDDKYSLTTPINSKKNKSGARNFLIILNTIQDLMFSYLSRNPKASFGFVGARTINIKKIKPVLKTKRLEHQNEDNTFSNTQRFRIYTSYVQRSFSEEKFNHIEFKSLSSYILLNRNSKLTPQDCSKFFLEYLNIS